MINYFSNINIFKIINHGVQKSCIFYTNFVYFTDDLALFNTWKLPLGFRFRVLTFWILSRWDDKNIDFLSIGRVRVAQKMLWASRQGSEGFWNPTITSWPVLDFWRRVLKTKHFIQYIWWPVKAQKSYAFTWFFN